ncbi:MAG: hypothetical protein RL033_6935 [Pseudomonadota bacterium]
MTDLRLVRVQAASGLLFSLFLSAHLLNTLVAPLGPASYERAQSLLRQVYQWPPVELVVVLLGFVCHVGASLALRVRRRHTARAPRTLRHRLHTGTGYFLLVFASLQHIPAVRGASLWYGVAPGFAGIAFSLVWLPAYYLPYYTLLGVSGGYHLLSGVLLALPRLGLRLPATWHRPGVVFASSGLLSLGVALAVAAFSGALFDVGDPAGGAYAQLLLRLGIAHP